MDRHRLTDRQVMTAGGGTKLRRRMRCQRNGCRGGSHLGLSRGAGFLEWSRYRERCTGILHVEVEGLAIRGEGRAGHFGLKVDRQSFFFQRWIRQIVQGEDVAFTFRRESDESVHAAPIFGNDDVTPGCNRDVVRTFETREVGSRVRSRMASTIGSLIEEFQCIRGRGIAKYLAQALFATVRIAEPEGTSGEGSALETVESQAVLVVRIRRRVFLVDFNPRDTQRRALIEQIGVVGGWWRDCLEGFQLATLLQRPGF